MQPLVAAGPAMATSGAERAPLLAVNRPGLQQQVAAGSKPASGPLSFTQYHTGWMDKQEAAFKGWINAVLSQPPVEGCEGDATQQPTALASRRMVARLRGLLWQLYSQDAELISVMLKVEQRIDGGQLRMRDEEAAMKNVKESAKGRAALAAYHPLWLRLGMEVVCGKAVTGDDAVAAPVQLAAFVKEEFLKEPQLARQHPASSKAYWEALARLVLKRLLLLVSLLDKAATAPGLPAGAPLLFRRDSKLKSSTQVLLEMLQSRLAGEGDMMRTLGRLGYRLAYCQDPRWELDFTVTNMATDLRDGLRLCKLAEFLTGKPRFFDSVRYPSDRRPVRLANLQLALDQFLRSGLPAAWLQQPVHQLKQQPGQLGIGGGSTAAGTAGSAAALIAELVDGDRGATLCLLWCLILHFQLPQLISLPAVRAEIELIRSKASPAAAGPNSTANSDAGVAAGTAAMLHKSQQQGAFPSGAGVHTSNSSSAVADIPHVAALLEWCAAVCGRYGLAVRGFGPCFADGSAFCLLVHHYLGHAYVALKDVYRPAVHCQAGAGGDGEAHPDGNDAIGWLAPTGATTSAARLEGARQNLGLVQRVVDTLGGIPPIVSAEDLAGQGASVDERGCILFTAFLCQRLLEISKEERAAMVIQRHWRNRQHTKPGLVREHLHRWIAAAAVLQRAVRAWLLRCGLRRLAAARRRGVAAVVRLQALWHGKVARRQFLRLRQAAVCIQASYRGKLARREVFHHVVVPRMLEAGLSHKRQLESRRHHARLARAAVRAQAQWRGRQQRRCFLEQRTAAVTIQATVRGSQQRRAFLRQCTAAVTVQKHYRGFAARKHALEQRAAAVAVQTVWRGWHARQRFLRLRAAAVAVQAVWRACQARMLLQQHRAARRLQAAWRGFAVRVQVAQQQAAAVRLQTAWRCFAARRTYQQQRQAAIVLQATERGRQQRRRFLLQKQAAVRMQAVWRDYAVRHLLQCNQAAVLIQSHARGFLTRHRLARQDAASTTIQCAVRRWLAARRAAAVVAVKRQMAELAALMKEYQRRTVAALCVQAAYRGHRARKEYRRRLAILREAERQQAEREAAALAVIAPWAEAFRDRAWFLRARRAAALFQAMWRRRHARRGAAVVVLQAAMRGFLVRRRLQRRKQAALRVQTVWRGWHVRATHPRRKQLADIRLRLEAATADAARAPHRSLGARTRAHLDALLACRHPALAIAALNGLALCTEAVLACCDIVATGGGLPVLLGIARAPCRSKEAAEALRATLACLTNICRAGAHADIVFGSEGLLHSLGDHLQQQRDKEEVFMSVVGLWQRLVCSPGTDAAARAQSLARQPDVLSKLEGVARLLALKQSADQKYLTKLEQQKGSDASARHATKALLANSRQLRALRRVLAATGASDEGLESGVTGGGGGADAALLLGKNTLVRAVLREQER